MSGIRVGIAAFVVALAIAPGSALGAAPGDTVSYSIPDSELGDTYTVSVDGVRVADGVDETHQPGVYGTFAMPDLGSQAHTATLVIDLVRAEDGSTRSYQSSIEYTPARPSPTPEPSPSPAPAPTTPPSPSRPAATQPQPAPPVRPPNTRAGGPSDADGDGGGQVTDIAHDTVSVLGQAVRKAVKPLTRRQASRARHRRRAHHKRRHRRLNAVKRTPEPTAVVPRRIEGPVDRRPDLSGEDFPGFGYRVAWKLLLGVVVAAGLLTLLLGLRTRSRRRGQELRDAAIEAELQELLRDMTARQAAALEHALHE